MRVKSPGPGAAGADEGICCGGGAEGVLKKAVAPSPLESALGFIGAAPPDSGPAVGGMTLGAAGGALPGPKPGRLSREKDPPPIDCELMDGVLRLPDTEGA